METTTIRAIETRCFGYRFRSRLEARWATFFQSLGVDWRYEPEGFDFGDILYLPDFWIRFPEMRQRPYPEGMPPERGFWVEIKPTVPSDAECTRCELLSHASGHCVYLVAGNIGGDYRVTKWHPRSGRLPDRAAFGLDWLLSYLVSDAIPENHTSGDHSDPYGLRSAFMAARSARFEFGEHGQ